MKIKLKINGINSTIRSVSLLSVLIFSLFALSFSMISDVHADTLNLSLPQNVVTEPGFGNIAIADLKVNQNGIYFLYWDTVTANLKFTTSTDNGDTWSTPWNLETGVAIEPSSTNRIFFNELGEIGVVWEDADDPTNIRFAKSTDNGLTFVGVSEFEWMNDAGGNLSWDADGNNIALTYSDAFSSTYQSVTVSNDFGSTWNVPVRVQSVTNDGIGLQSQGLIKVNGSNMFVIWTADSSGTESLYFTKSNDDGITWDTPVQLSTDVVGSIPPKMVLNNDANKILVIWSDEVGNIFQVTSLDGGNFFSSPVLIDNRIFCDISYDVDSLDNNVIFTCDGLSNFPSNTGRFFILSNDFGQTYSSFAPLTGTDQIPIFRTFSDNVGIGNNFYSIWENPLENGNLRFISYSQDKGQTFNYETITGMQGKELDNGISSRQAVFENNWYWFVRDSTTTIDMISGVITEPIIPTDHYLAYDVKTENKQHDNHGKYSQYEKYLKYFKEHHYDKYSKFAKYLKYFKDGHSEKYDRYFKYAKYFYDKYDHHDESSSKINSMAQKWELTSSGDITSELNGFCLDIEGADTTNGANVIMWPCHGGDNQKWELTSSGDITSELNGFCLDIEGADTTNGANVIMWPCHGGDNQKWTVSDTNQISSKLNDKCLSIKDANENKKANVEMLTCNMDSIKTDKKDVTLSDEFEGESKYEVKKIKKLLNPVDKNNEGIFNEESHLVEYQIKQLKGEQKFKGIKDVPVFNQFGELTVDVGKARTLLVPSTKDHSEVPNELEEITINHFKCYDAKESKHTSKFEKRDVNLSDQFGEVNMQVYKPKMLCSPVDKNNEGIVNEDIYLMCYDLKKINGEPKFKKITVFTNDQFASEKLKAEKQERLCVPSTVFEENTEPVSATLTILKITNVDETFDFTILNNITEVKSTESITTIEGTGSTVQTELTLGHQYTISEDTLPSNFALTDSNCTINGTPIGTTFTPAEADVIVCTFENTFTAPPLDPATLTIVKNTNQDATFGFEITSTDSTVPVSITTTSGTGSSSSISVASGIEYAINETSIPSNFALTDSNCTINGTPIGTTFTPAEADVIVCTFENTFTAPTITIVKNAIGGDNTFGFEITSTDSTVPVSITTTSGTGSSSSIILTSGITYSVNEIIIPTGYAITSSNCTINGTPIGTTFTPAEADVIVCTFENTFTPPPSGTFTVTISKSTNVDSQFTFSVTNDVTGIIRTISVPTEEGEGFGKRTITMILGQSFTITENPKTGYTVTNSSCTIGGISVGTTFTPAIGNTVACTFTNAFS